MTVHRHTIAPLRFNLSTRHEGTETSSRAVIGGNSRRFNLSTRHEGTETCLSTSDRSGDLRFNLSTRHEGTETRKDGWAFPAGTASTYRPDMRVLKHSGVIMTVEFRNSFNLSTRHEGTETLDDAALAAGYEASTYRPDMRVLKLAL